MGGVNNRGEPLVASAEQVGEILRKWELEELSERPLGAIGAYSPRVVLLERIGVSDKTLRRIMDGDVATVSESLVERILVAIGREDLWYTDIKLFKNPAWTQGKWTSWKEEHRVRNRSWQYG